MGGEADTRFGEHPAAWERWAPWLVLGLALALRAVYLIELRDSPAFEAPAIDAARYDALARSLLGGEPAGAEWFWQPLFYPLWLAGLHALSGGSIVFARGVGLLLGVLTCLLTWSLGRRLAGPRVGLAAGLILAAWGPAIFFEAELLAAGWASLWGVLLLLLWLHGRETPRAWVWAGSGLASALAILTRPTFLPLVAAAALWWPLAARRAGASRSRVAGCGTLALVGLLTPLLLVSAWEAKATGRFSFLPLSGGLNLYLGNQPDSCRLLALRPGADWDRLVGQPAELGISSPAGQDDFFRARVWQGVKLRPLAFAAGLGAKGLRLLGARELPRNVDVYTAGRWSALLGVLVWRLGPFGFPFGLLLPLAVVGLAAGWRRTPWPVLAFPVLVGAAIVLVFVSARYRLPLIPVCAVLGASGAVALWRAARDGPRRRLLVLGSLGALVWLVSNLQPPACQERGPFAAEVELGAGIYRAGQGRWSEAIARYRTALRLAPDLSEARANLSLALASQARESQATGRRAEALEAFSEAAALAPQEPALLNDLAWLLTGIEEPALARPAEALRLAERACVLTKSQAAALLDTLAVAYLAAGRLGEAVAVACQALARARATGDQELQRAIEARWPSR